MKMCLWSFCFLLFKVWFLLQKNKFGPFQCSETNITERCDRLLNVWLTHFQYGKVTYVNISTHSFHILGDLLMLNYFLFLFVAVSFRGHISGFILKLLLNRRYSKKMLHKDLGTDWAEKWLTFPGTWTWFPEIKLLNK